MRETAIVICYVCSVTNFIWIYTQTKSLRGDFSIVYSSFRNQKMTNGVNLKTFIGLTDK